MAEDLRVWEAARHGNTDAVGQIFDRFAPVLFRYAMGLCHDPAEADQIVGDVFAQLLEHLSEGRGPRSNFRAYLYQVAYHVLIDHVRQASHLMSMQDAHSLPDGRVPVSIQVEGRELIRAVQLAMCYKLTEEQRQVILLRFVEGFSLKETALITGKTVNGVSVLQNRAIEKLRKTLSRKFGATPDYDFAGESSTFAA